MPCQSALEFYSGFAWALPRAFSTALAECRFEKGDVLYDSRSAYERDWNSHHANYAIQIKHPIRSAAQGRTLAGEQSFSRNWRTEVTFDLMHFPSRRTREMTTTQGRLYTVLWKGYHSAALDDPTPEPTPPLTLAQANQFIENAGHHFEKELPDLSLFIVAYDLTHPASTEKYEAIQQVLIRQLQAEVSYIPAAELKLAESNEFAPTVFFAGFGCAATKADFEEALKPALYVPSANKKTDRTNFRLSAHGLLIPKR